jgi:hypothetical protein
VPGVNMPLAVGWHVKMIVLSWMYKIITLILYEYLFFDKSLQVVNHNSQLPTGINVRANHQEVGEIDPLSQLF